MTTTTLSSKGQVVLPRLVRSQLHVYPGDKFSCVVDGHSLILTPLSPRHRSKEYVTSPLTGLRVTKAREGAEPVTSDMIKALLEDYP